MKHLSDEELQHGIDRCEARLSGVMPKGFMSLQMIKEALKQYKEELRNRGVLKIDF